MAEPLTRIHANSLVELFRPAGAGKLAKLRSSATILQIADRLLTNRSQRSGILARRSRFGRFRFGKFKWIPQFQPGLIGSRSSRLHRGNEGNGRLHRRGCECPFYVVPSVLPAGAPLATTEPARRDSVLSQLLQSVVLTEHRFLALSRVPCM